MKKKTSEQILELGFASMGDHYSMRKEGKQFTLLEHRIGDSTMLEIVIECKTRKLSADEKETLSRIAVANREGRLESINIGNQTSILYSFSVPEASASDCLRDYMSRACEYLQDLVIRVAKPPYPLDAQTSTLKQFLDIAQ